MTTIHWFRRDLRLADNPALNSAWEEAQADDSQVVGLFVLDDGLWGPSGSPRRDYLLASLRALDESMGGRLVVRRGDPVDVLPSVAHEVGAQTVHVAESFEPYGRARDEKVESALAEAGVRLQRTGSAYAVSPGRVLTRTGTPYRVFTPFRTAWLDHGWRGPAADLGPVDWADLASEPLPEADGEPLRPAGESAALERWHEFLEDVDGYDSDRDRPDLDLTSRLSVPLKWGEIHPRTLLADLKQVRGDGAASFRSELAWREFHADVLFHSPEAATLSIREVMPDDAWAPRSQADRWFQAWTEGRTGYPMVDAGMRQLLAEGWMHGRVRMIVGSFLVKDLHIPWQRGARHFMQHLLDADRSQNQLNWQWVAGTGLDASPYFRIFNPVTQGLKFDPDGDYVRRWVPELRAVPGKAVHEPWKLPDPPEDYPDQLVDHSRERKESLDAYARFKDA